MFGKYFLKVPVVFDHNKYRTAPYKNELSLIDKEIYTEHFTFFRLDFSFALWQTESTSLFFLNTAKLS